MTSEKVALITGATSGIGKAFAEKFASMGYNLIITGRREQLINKVSADIQNHYKIKVDTFIIDLSTEDAIDKLIKNIQNKQISVLINNAGFGIYKPFYNISSSEFMNMVNLHVVCTLKLIYALLPGMMERNEGIIINVSSENAYFVGPNCSIYSGTKAFIKLFTEGLYLDLKEYNIKVQTLCPSFTWTDFHEKIGISKSEQVNKGLYRWESPENVVKKSMKCLGKNDPLCLCGGIFTKLGILLQCILSKKTYYNLIYKSYRKKDL